MINCIDAKIEAKVQFVGFIHLDCPDAFVFILSLFLPLHVMMRGVYGIDGGYDAE